MGTVSAAPQAAFAKEFHQVMDTVGRQATVPVDPRRIVALAPSITELIFALGQEERLVGATRYSDYPPAAKQLPKVGSYIQLDIERIVALEPDLCLAIRDGNPIASVRRLEQFGLPVFAVDPRNLESVQHTLLILGELLDAQDQARKIAADMADRIQRVVDLVRTQPRQPRVFFQIGVSPIVSIGTPTFIHELITRAGGINVAAGPTPYPRFTVEQVLEQAPEVILITSMARSAVFEKVKAQWESWPGLPAVRNKTIFILPSNLFDRPTPRLVQGLELLARKLHPGLFGEIP